jgi:hypothetical protein
MSYTGFNGVVSEVWQPAVITNNKKKSELTRFKIFSSFVILGLFPELFKYVNVLSHV